MTGRRGLVVGAVGWDHDGWAGHFYPDDLPVDWRLTYYANEFSAVLVPVSCWQLAGDQVILDWLESVAEGFLFFLESGRDRRSDQNGRRCRQLLGEKFGGMAAPGPGIIGDDEPWDLRQLRVRLGQLAGDEGSGRTPSVFLAGAPPDIEHLRAAKQLVEMLML